MRYKGRMLYIGKQIAHHLIDIGINLAKSRIGFKSLYFLDRFDGFRIRHITADFKGYSILPHSLTRKKIERRCHLPPEFYT